MGAICGIFSLTPGQPVDPRSLTGMDSTLCHRGPHQAGVWVREGIGLAQRGLGLEGEQPGAGVVTAFDGALAIAFCGRLFNRGEIEGELRAEGTATAATSDAALVLQLYAERGEACVAPLNGQFAFAIWDARSGSVFLARDALGICPLQFAFTGGQLLFSSEAKAILAYPGFRAASDDLSVAEQLLCGAVFEGRTMFAGIQTLDAGSTLTASPSGHRVSRYWKLPHERNCTGSNFDAFDGAELVAAARDAIRVRISGDAPWGVLLSGGTDSSALTAWGGQLSSCPVQTFSIDFATAWKGIDLDNHYSTLVAEHFGTRHQSFLLEAEEYFSALERLAWHVERPYNKTAATMHLLSRHLAPFARFVLSGEGMDEMLAGYAGARGLGMEQNLDEEVRCFPWAPSVAAVLGLLSEEFRNAIRAEELFQSRLTDALAEALPNDPLNQKLYLYSTYFLRELLALHEQGSLAAGVETRFPYLDRRILELLVPLPSAFKFRDGQTKAIFKRVIRSLVPAHVLERRKTHLPIPRDPTATLRHLQLARDLLCAPDARTGRYFDRARLITFLKPRGSSADALTQWQVSMNMMTLELLYRQFHL